jgi:7,8-dihydropterin-6-yl-methyl-4-(beta-D-ribofuranosyl)aminobenzene 5'-phosphate synthase
VLGCAHPGVIKIIEFCRDISKIPKVYGVIGGFHINNKLKTEELIRYFKKINIQLVSPCHCTGNTAKIMISKAFQDLYIKNGSGLKIEI